MKVAFDLSSYLWTCLLAGKDEEGGKEVLVGERKVWVNSATHGYENIINAMVAVLNQYSLTPMNTIIVVEGLFSKSKRLLIDADYKAKRDSRPPEAYQEFQNLRTTVIDLWRSLGATTITQDYAEGDDVLAWLANNVEEDLIIASYDNDLAALNGKNSYGAEVETYINGLRGVNKYGMFPHHLITSYKATVGDSSDNIKGCPGFGEKAFENFVAQYGIDGLQELQDMLQHGSLGPLHMMAEDPAHPLVKKLVAQEVKVLQSFEVARLRPEWVNTMQHPAKIEAGKVRELAAGDDERLKQWFGRGRLVTADNFEKAKVWCLDWIARSEFVALDIETSTPLESDEWLEQRGKPEAVDVFGSKLTGMSLTFGDNMQYSMYFSVDHRDTNNIRSEDLRDFIVSIKDKQFAIQNVSFELCVLFNEWGEAWKDNGYHGYLPNVLDTKLEASYVDENLKLGLKDRSKIHLGYQQVDYATTTSVEGMLTELPKGGRIKAVLEKDDEGNPIVVRKQYKMNELPATHVLSYGLDDTICTAALHNYYKLIMQLEHTWQVYLDVEIAAAYQHAQNFTRGIPISLEKMLELSSIDDKTYDEAWATVRTYLIAKGWTGTQPPTYTPEITAKEIKEAYAIVNRLVDSDETDETAETAESPKDPVLASRVRTSSKLCKLIESEGHALFAAKLERCLAGEAEQFTEYARTFFTGEPLFNDGSTKQMTNLLYEVMGLPVRVRNKPTAAAKARGERLGSPKTDALAIEYALRDAGETEKAVLNGLKLMAMVGTRRSLYYSKYVSCQHWKDGMMHSSHNQCATNTRRASSSDENVQQLPKHPKVEGQPARFREVIVPHHKDAVVVSLDFSSQELRVIADYSKDEALVACYVGEHKKDMHALTGLGIAKRKQPEVSWSYESFIGALESAKDAALKFVKECRTLGKKTNFTTEYGAQKEKLAQTLLISEDEAQAYIDAREAAFPGVVLWKESVVAEAKRNGFVKTMLGAVRHLREALTSKDKWIASKSERQAVNFKVQSSSAEMTKKAEGRMWEAELFTKFDAVCYGPIHDEVVASVAIKDLFEFIPAMHHCMVQPYGGMTIPIESSISFGPSFGVQIEIGDKPTGEAIAKGLEELKKLTGDANV